MSQARLANPWELQVINFPGELTRLWDETFPDTELGYLVEAGTPLFELSTQRLYTWRSTVGTNAIAAVQRFWENEGISDPLDRAECAKIAIGPGKPYLFGEVEFMPDLRTIARRVNRFESPVILDALGEHLRIIDRVVKKPVAYPRGALMLAAAAAERAWKLAVADGKIVPERKDAFSEKSVGPNIKIFGNAIAQLTDAKWAQILSNARAFIVFKDAKSRSLAIDIDDDDDLYSDEEYYMKANKTSMSTIEDDADSL
ncbi:hypothetical protein EVJ58_g4590 [Rhodofomes roseus]|uniref:Uncharacterized protein n=1 Tax=Rhodofomes roseus TaxID=34475 RepID=A0A4Y9YFH4_9APHY|nr:hypothetical protein EVJ58_g4590 [Rhodofomes roseus]